MDRIQCRCGAEFYVFKSKFMASTSVCEHGHIFRAIAFLSQMCTNVLIVTSMFRDSCELFCDADDDLLTIAAFLTCIYSIHTHTHRKREREKGKKAPKVNKL